MRRCGSALGQRHPQSCVLAMAAAALTCERALRHRTARLAGGNARAGASLGRLWHDVRLLLQAGPSGPVTSLARAASPQFRRRRAGGGFFGPQSACRSAPRS